MKKAILGLVLLASAISLSGCIVAPVGYYHPRPGWCYYHPGRCY